MTKPILYTLFILLTISSAATATRPTATATGRTRVTATTTRQIGPSNRDINFIKTSCKATTYPTTCISSLSIYAKSIQTSPQRLAETALAVTLNQAKSTKLFISRIARFTNLKKREIQAIKDCLEEIEDSVDRLTNSVVEVKMSGRVKGRDQFWFHISNAQTWTSAALTNANTCSDGFSGRVMDGRVKNSVRTRIVNLGRETSNALALINAFAKKY